MGNYKWIDFTVWPNEAFNEKEWRNSISHLFERWAYGREIAPNTGRYHLQCRGVLYEALDIDNLKYLNMCGCMHITATHVRNFEYVQKTGEYWASWEILRPEYVDCTFRPWQRELLEQPWDDRTIEFVIDFEGNSGKTFFGRALDAQHKAVYIPPMPRPTDILAAIMDKPPRSTYCLDIPRAFTLTKDFFSMIECLKNGLVYDVRFKYREKDIGFNPRVLVFLNECVEIPLSKDRIYEYSLTWDGLQHDHILGHPRARSR